jgi:FSR family fosmidomycin resistance protein-like MFS transporter
VPDWPRRWWRLATVTALQFATPAGRRRPKVGAGGTASTNVFGFLGLPVIWLAFLFFFLITSAFSGLQNFSVPVLGGIYGISAAAAVAALTGYLLGPPPAWWPAASSPCACMPMTARSAPRWLAPPCSPSLLATGLPPAWGVVPLMVGIGVGVGLAGPSRDLLVRRVATESIAGGKESPAFGRVYGFVYSGLDVGLALGPLAFGILLDAGGRDGVLPGVALLQILAVVTVLAMGRRVARHA